MSNKRNLVIRWGLLTAICSAVIACAVGPKQDTYATTVSQAGDISLPEDFRKSMRHLGSWFVPNGDASGFHDVYTQPSTIKAYRATGSFPDGAILVKELRAHTAGNYTTGNGVSYANDGLKQWFVMVKDTQGRFENNPLWGDGWGWALFQPGKIGNVATDYKSDCLGCHIPAKVNDWIYVEAYPTLDLEN